MSSPRDDRSDLELSALLSELRVDPEDEAGFGAQLARRLAEAGPALACPKPRGWLAVLGSGSRRTAGTEHDGRRGMPTWLVGSLCGTAAGVAAFFMLSAAQHADSSLTAPVVLAPRAERPTSEQPPAGPANESATREAPAACPPTVESHAQVVVVPTGKVALVRLQFDVSDEVPDAEFSVLLPAGLSFFSEGEALPDRVFHFRAPLHAGSNDVPVAVLAEQPGRHRLTATATVDGQVVVHAIVFDVQEPA